MGWECSALLLFSGMMGLAKKGGAFAGCSNGVTAESIMVSNNVYISLLRVPNQDLNGKTVTCSVETSKTDLVGSATIQEATTSPPSPRIIHAHADDNGNMIFGHPPLLPDCHIPNPSYELTLSNSCESAGLDCRQSGRAVTGQQWRCDGSEGLRALQESGDVCKLQVDITAICNNSSLGQTGQSVTIRPAQLFAEAQIYRTP